MHKNVKLHKKGSNVALHAWNNDNRIDFNPAKVTDKESFKERKPLES